MALQFFYPERNHTLTDVLKDRRILPGWKDLPLGVLSLTSSPETDRLMGLNEEAIQTECLDPLTMKLMSDREGEQNIMLFNIDDVPGQAFQNKVIELLENPNQVQWTWLGEGFFLWLSPKAVFITQLSDMLTRNDCSDPSILTKPFVDALKKFERFIWSGSNEEFFFEVKQEPPDFDDAEETSIMSFKCKQLPKTQKEKRYTRHLIDNLEIMDKDNGILQLFLHYLAHLPQPTTFCIPHQSWITIEYANYFLGTKQYPLELQRGKFDLEPLLLKRPLTLGRTLQERTKFSNMVSDDNIKNYFRPLNLMRRGKLPSPYNDYITFNQSESGTIDLYFTSSNNIEFDNLYLQLLKEWAIYNSIEKISSISKRQGRNGLLVSVWTNPAFAVHPGHAQTLFQMINAWKAMDILTDLSLQVIRLPAVHPKAKVGLTESVWSHVQLVNTTLDLGKPFMDLIGEENVRPRTLVVGNADTIYHSIIESAAEWNEFGFRTLCLFLALAARDVFNWNLVFSRGFYEVFQASVQREQWFNERKVRNVVHPRDQSTTVYFLHEDFIRRTLSM